MTSRRIRLGPSGSAVDVVVPSTANPPSATKYLSETGEWTVPAGDSGGDWAASLILGASSGGSSPMIQNGQKLLGESTLELSCPSTMDLQAGVGAESYTQLRLGAYGTREVGSPQVDAVLYGSSDEEGSGATLVVEGYSAANGRGGDVMVSAGTESGGHAGSIALTAGAGLGNSARGCVILSAGGQLGAYGAVQVCAEDGWVSGLFEGSGKLNQIATNNGSEPADDIPVLRLLSNGSLYGADTGIRVGMQDPVAGGVTGPDGQLYIRVEGPNSNLYIRRGGVWTPLI